MLQPLVYSDADDDILTLSLSPPSSSAFNILQDGTIVTNRRIDREQSSGYSLVVSVSDGVQSSSCPVQVNVEDVNDNSPMIHIAQRPSG